MRISAFSQSGYPRLTVLQNGDTVALISTEQIRKLNHMQLELQMTYEIIDSLIVNDSLHQVKENYFQLAIATRDKRYAVLERQKQKESELKDEQIEGLKKQKRFILAGGGVLLIVLLLFK